MKCKGIAVWILVGGLTLVMPISGLASDGQKGKPMDQIAESQSKKPASLATMPVYKPPLRGAPVGRVGGGTRGVGSELPVLAALVPEHVGLTAQEQPSLYWYLSKLTNCFVEFTLIDDQSIQPLLEKRIGPPVQAGVHCIRLADYGIRLSTGKQYRWFVALVPDPEHRSKDIIAGGGIERIELPEILLTKLTRAGKGEVPYIYAEGGIWYEALSAISDLIDSTPDNADLRKKRASLLEQVGLSLVFGDEI